MPVRLTPHFFYLPLVILALCGLMAGCAQTHQQQTITTTADHQLSTTTELTNNDELCFTPSSIDEMGYEGPQFVSVWNRLRDGYQLSYQDNPRIDTYIKSYTRHPSFLPRVGERSEPFLYYIVEQLEQRQMPLELALLPIVESAFDPFAYSHGRASGLWQFIPGTGTQYGLKQNWWYDGRRDAIAATDAALTYLSDLHDRLDGDWLLALAAYNSGEGNVRKAIRRNKKLGKSTDFWSLELPKETEAYVPQLLAISKIVFDPEEYNLTIYDIPNTPYFEQVDTESQIDLAQAAEMAGIDINELYQLNAGFNRWATDPKGPHRLFIPADKAQALREQLAQEGSNRISWERYKVKSGDSLISIAKQHHTTVALLRDNNKIKGNTIRIGQMMLIPKASQSSWHYAQSEEQRLKRTQSHSSGSEKTAKTLYTVKPGDSFWIIAKRYKVGVRQLAKWNGMAPSDTLRAKQTLVIWTPTSAPEANTTASNSTPLNRSTGKDPVIRKVAYTVRSGDSLARIAGKFNLSISDIARWNPVKKSDYIHPGQLLTLYVDVTRSSL